MSQSHIKILVEIEFIQERSNVEENQYFFAYTVTIKNQGSHTIQLISRHWIINNAHNEKFEVKGDGVVGEQPIIQPGAEFTYTSGTEINTPSGNMKGSYHMVTKEGLEFDAKISEFELNMPRTLH